MTLHSIRRGVSLILTYKSPSDQAFTDGSKIARLLKQGYLRILGSSEALKLVQHLSNSLLISPQLGHLGCRILCCKVTEEGVTSGLHGSPSSECRPPSPKHHTTLLLNVWMMSTFVIRKWVDLPWEYNFSQAVQILRATPLSRVLYHLHTLYLFTASDLKTIVIPSTIFGILGIVAQLTGEPVVGIPAILQRTPRVFLWTWLYMLPFNISNQRQPSAIKEDLLNKPWRPLPSERLTPKHAKVLMLCSYSTAVVFSLFFRGTRSCLALMLLGWWYNDLNGAESCWIRNFINAAGYLTFVYGAVEVAVGSQVHLTEKGHLWFLLIGGIIFSTVHIQDIPDLEGDAARGRETLPLVIGEMRARWSIAILVPIWSLLAPVFWQVGSCYYILPFMLSGLIAGRMVCTRGIEADKLSFKIWNVWIVAIYMIPVFRA